MAQDYIDNGDAMLRDLGIDIRDLAGEFEHCQRAPTAMNQQAFTLTLTSPRTVKRSPGLGYGTNIDLGIVSYQFEIAAGTNHFDWAD